MTTTRHDARKYHLHTPGVLYIAVTILLGFAAINSQNNLLFWLFGIGIAGILVSGVISGAGLMGLELEQLPGVQGRAKQETTIRYAVRTGGRYWPAFGLHIEQDFEAQTDEPFVARAFVGHIGPGKRIVVEGASQPTLRGVYTGRTIRAWSTFPFGIIKKSLEFQPASILVIVAPPRVPLRPNLIKAIAISGQLPSPERAERTASSDFFALREYMVGDARRHIAWNASARTGTTLTREFARERSRRVRFVVQGSTRDEIEAALALAGSLAEQALGTGHEVSIARLDDPNGMNIVTRGSLPRVLASFQPARAAPGPGLRGVADIPVGSHAGARGFDPALSEKWGRLPLVSDTAPSTVTA